MYSTRVCMFFFFSSRRRHTRFDCDWSSDVCSSDLLPPHVRDAAEIGEEPLLGEVATGEEVALAILTALVGQHVASGDISHVDDVRSEERRVGKECRSRWSPYH